MIFGSNIIVALYDEAQILPLPDMYGKIDIDTTPLITHTYPLEHIAEAYDLFENRRDNVIKVAIK